ncbi:MAG: TIGR03032 family protein [Cyanobacteriota bacterium]|nr:TIGR03032 family protein [Cyanobacteriota bacterium]
MDPLTHPLRSVHTTNFPEILAQLGISLLISTYQAGKLIVVRADGDKLNTHFRMYAKPMGLAVAGNKLAVGSAHQIWELHNMPAVAAKLPPAGKHDACFMPRRTHITGDIDIHEMAYGTEGLWFLNTRFSCLCTLDEENSFVPRWRPPFISAYDLTDRCHLNGLALLNGIPRYVTALGATDTASGWRTHKANGGILMDVASGEILLKGLSMPHSPRCYQNHLWFLESGQGSLAQVNGDQASWTTITHLPGFTRGIDFYGSLAFIGLSKVRETAVFSGIPLTQRLSERICGVWVVSIETGQPLAFLKFEEGVEEIFAVQVLPGLRFPEVFGDPRFADPAQDQWLGSSYILPEEAMQAVATPAPLPIFRADGVDRDPEPVITRLAVILSVFNIASKDWATFERTLTSIQASLNYCYQHYPFAKHLQHEIVIVDDASQDQTWVVLNERVAQTSTIRLIRQATHQGRAAARNTAIQTTQAQALFFCDEDDIYLESHILICLRLLNRPLDPNIANPIYRLPHSYPAAVKTGLRLADPLDTHEYELIKQRHTLNLCIRREAHDFIEGFPTDASFRTASAGATDHAYCEWLTSFFSVIWIPDQTVAVQGYLDNHLDRQPNFLPSDSQALSPSMFSDKNEELPLIQQKIREKVIDLSQKFEQDFNPDHLLALGNAAHAQGNREEAVYYFRRCLELAPEMKVARYNLGVTYGDLGQWQEAEYYLQALIKEDPDNPKIYNSLGFIYTNQNRLSEAIPCYEKALQIDPQFADAHMNIGMALLKLGQLQRGWLEFEWRWQTRQFTPFQCPHPRWQGEDISHQTLLIHTEQGAGDSIQFCRFISLAAQRCRSVILVGPDHLLRLLQGIPEVSRLYRAGEIPLAAFQVYSPLMSLPYCLGIHSLDQIPNHVPYLRIPEIPEPLKISTPPGLLNIGICWAGSPTQGNDHNRSSHLRD